MGGAYLVRRGGSAVKETGGCLNFEVVGGTTQPSSPKENTIWINTDQEITGWSINSTDLTSAQTELYNDDIGLHIGAYIKSDSTTTASADWRYTDLIPLPNNTKSVTVKTGSTSSTNPYHAFYDASGKFVSSVQRKTGTNTHNVPSGAVNMRLSLSKNDVPSLIAVHDAEADDGFVWIGNTNEKQKTFVSFNALVENEIFVNVSKLMHYQDGQWIIPEAKMYQDGGWQVVNKLVLWNGTELADGIEFDIEYNTNEGTLTIDKEEGCLHLFIPALSSSQNVVFATDAIDVTKYNTITCRTYMRGWSGGYFGLTTDPTKLSYSSTGGSNAGVSGLTAQCRPTTESNTEYTGTDTLDISSITGLQYFVFGTAGTASSGGYTGEVKMYSIEFSV